MWVSPGVGRETQKESWKDGYWTGQRPTPSEIPKTKTLGGLENDPTYGLTTPQYVGGDKVQKKDTQTHTQ